MQPAAAEPPANDRQLSCPHGGIAWPRGTAPPSSLPQTPVERSVKSSPFGGNPMSGARGQPNASQTRSGKQRRNSFSLRRGRRGTEVKIRRIIMIFELDRGASRLQLLRVDRSASRV